MYLCATPSRAPDLRRPLCEKNQQLFDIEREKRDPRWGDPSYRIIPRDARRGEIGVAHLYLNPDDIETDFNIALPLEVFAELERLGEIGVLAEHNYSFMGYQGRSCDAWRETYGPELARSLQADAVNLLLLAPLDRRLAQSDHVAGNSYTIELRPTSFLDWSFQYR